MVSNMVTIMGTIMVTNMHRLTFAMRECLRDLQVGSPSSSAEPPFDITHVIVVVTIFIIDIIDIIIDIIFIIEKVKDLPFPGR